MLLRSKQQKNLLQHHTNTYMMPSLMKKYDDFRREILEDLTNILEKIVTKEKQEGTLIFSDDFIIQLSYTMEKAVDLDGFTDETLAKHKPNFKRDKNN